MQSLRGLAVLAAASLPSSCRAHWRLTKPVPRSGGVYENDPLPPDANTQEEWVCRHAQPNPAVQRPTIAAGSTTSIVYGTYPVGHAGDCAVYVSYDLDRPRRTMRWVKIANLPDCRSQINQDVPITIPAELPAGNAVFRWDQYALHQGTFIEWFIQCADVTFTSSSTRSWESFDTFSIIDNDGTPAYPSSLSSYRSAYAQGQSAPGEPGFWMTGPACVDDSLNQCALTAVGTKGYTGFGGRDRPAGPPAPASPAPTTAGETCYGELAELAVDEGIEVGKVETSSAAECQRACDANPACRSFSLSPTWGCYMKDRSFSGGEATRVHYDYQTYYKKPCDGTASLEPTPSPTAAPSAAPVSAPTAPYPAAPGPSPPPPAGDAMCCYDAGCGAYGTALCNAADAWCSGSAEACQSCGGSLCADPAGAAQAAPSPPPAAPSPPAPPTPEAAGGAECCYAGGCASYGTPFCNPAGSWCSGSAAACAGCGGTLCSGASLVSTGGRAGRSKKFLHSPGGLGGHAPAQLDVDVLASAEGRGARV